MSSNSDALWAEMLLCMQEAAPEAQAPVHQVLLQSPEQVFQTTHLNVGIVCPKCKQQDVTYKMDQNRSGDEGMTANCQCRQCHFHFRLRV